MTWFRRKHKPPSEATRAREKAERDLARLRAQTPFYEEIGERMKHVRETNHFGIRIAALYRGEQ